MGRDKAALILEGQSLLERLIRTVSPLVGQQVVMLATGQSLPRMPREIEESVEVGRDTRAVAGPLQGIADALPRFRPEIETLFVLSCDLPYLTSEVLQQMRSLLSPDVDGVCAEVGGRVNPLLAVYHRQLVLESILPAAAGRSCMVLIDNRRIVRIPPPVDNLLAFNDVNTPQAFESARSHFTKNT